MNSLWRVLGMGGPTIPNFNFTFNKSDPQTISFATPTLHWKLRPGVRDEDKLPVTIFEVAITPSAGSDDCSELARNALKRAKSLILPGVLRTFDAVEHAGSIFIATEECISLQSLLLNDDLRLQYYEDSPEKFECVVAHGLHTICQALNNIHKANLLHGNVSHDSVFVLKSGEWRLFGLELMSVFGEAHTIFYRYCNSLLPEYRRPPELSTAGSSASGSTSIDATDAWGVGCLIHAVFSRKLDGALKSSDMRAFRGMPRSLQPGFIGLTSTNPKLRFSIEKFLHECSFISDSEYVSIVQQLEELALKDAVDRDAVYRKLASVLQTFPSRSNRYVVLGHLNKTVQFGGGSSAAILEPVLKIGAQMNPEDFAELCAPMVTSMFSSQDHLVRIRLLSTAGQYAKLLPQTLLQDKIWPQYILGFQSRSADMREQSIRALVYFAPLLGEKLLLQDCMKYLSLMQQDKEGPIRTNSTICLSLIAPHLPEVQRGKLLVNGFGRMLKDPFTPSRTAALKSISTHTREFTPNQIGDVLLPAVSPCLLDVQPDVREVALGVVDQFVARMREYHSEAPPPPPPPTASSTSPSSETPTAAQPAGTDSNAPGAGGGGRGFWGWGFGGLGHSQSGLDLTASTPTTPAPQGAATTTGSTSRGPAAHQDPSMKQSTSVSSHSPPPPNASGGGPDAIKRSNDLSAANNNDGWEDALADVDESKKVVPIQKIVPAAPSGGAPTTSLKLSSSKKKGFGGATKAE